MPSYQTTGSWEACIANRREARCAFIVAMAFGLIPLHSQATPMPDLVPLVEEDSGEDCFAPATLSPSLSAAAESVRRGRGRAALAALDGASPDDLESPAGIFFHAEALKSEGMCELAIPKYERLLIGSPLLTDRVQLHLGECLLELGKVRQAAAALLDLPDDSRHHASAIRLRARALIASGDPLGAIDTLRDHLPPGTFGRPASEGHLLSGLARAQLGEKERALQHLRLAVLSAPSGPHARPAASKAIEIIDEVRQASEDDPDAAPWRSDPRFSPEASRAWRLFEPLLGQRNTRALLAQRSSHRGLAPLFPLVLACRGRLEADTGRHEIALALFTESGTSAARHVRPNGLSPAGATGAHSSSVPVSGATPLGPLMLDSDLAARARREAARSAAALGRSSLARRHLDAVVADHPEHPLSVEVRLESARLAIRVRDYSAAAAGLEGLLLIAPVGSSRPQALFMLGWSHFRLENYEQAARFFEAAAFESPAEAGFEDSYGGSAIASAARAFYWAGRAKAMSGREEAAREDWVRVLSSYPLSYYALLAGDMLGTPGALAIGSANATQTPSERPLDPRVVRAREAMALGWREEARRELNPLITRPAMTDGRSLYAAAEIMRRMGRISSARGLYRAAAIHGSADLSPAERETAWRQSFPLRYQEFIRRESERWGYSPWLLFGLVLRESGFAPCARSHVGARGLAQLMMPTARDSAADLRMPAPTQDLLCDPEYNLRLGAWHLRKLLRHYRGSEILALAAYNGGQGSVDRWLARSVDLPIDVFVEEIPFEETRAYVRMVISAMRGYEWTWQDLGDGFGRKTACLDC